MIWPPLMVSVEPVIQPVFSDRRGFRWIKQGKGAWREVRRGSLASGMSFLCT